MTIYLEEGEVYPTNRCGDIRIIEIRGYDDADVEFLNSGYRTTTSTDSIRRGSVQDHSLYPQVGQIYQTTCHGPVEVLEYYNYHTVLIRFLDSEAVTITNSSSLRSGKVRHNKKISFTRKPTRIKSITTKTRNGIKVGDIFNTTNCGDVEVIEHRDKESIVVRFTETGSIVSCRSSNLHSGSIKDPMVPTVFGVGFIGVGPHRAYYRNEDNKLINTPTYVIWQSMLRRCYDTKLHQRNPIYKGSTVHTDWHNYQTFYEDLSKLEGYQEWIDYQEGNSTIGYQLDRRSSSDMYSLENCYFVSISNKRKEPRNRSKSN